VRREELSELHYIAHMSNVASILGQGILSNRRASQVGHTSVAMQAVQDRRAKVVVPGGRKLHDYANLYVCARNPMLYKRQGQHADLCVLQVSTDVLDLLGVVVTDANASSDYVRFLSYRRSSYGPFAPELKALVTRLENNGLIREERLGRMFAVKPGPTFEDAWRAYERDLADWRDTIEALADLFMRMRTQQAELAATVHFAAKGVASKKATDKPSEMDLLGEVMSWKQKRRPPLNEADVAATIRGLSVLGWLQVKPSTDLPVSEEAVLDV